MRPEELRRVKDLIRDATTEQELAEISSIIEEAKGKVSLGDRGLGFWEGKTPCWEMFRCPEQVRNECPAHNYRSSPCWEIEGTYCKRFDSEMKGQGTQVCEVCRVYKRWGQGEPIQIKLFGKGFDPVAKVLDRAKAVTSAIPVARKGVMRIGDTIRIRECAAIPALVGQTAEIVQLQTQGYERYAVRPIWGKVTTGEHVGKTYGFRENEVETI